MTAEQFGAVIRTIIQFAAGYFVARGVGDAELWLAITAGAVSIGSALWSFFWIKKASTAPAP
jgi:hypothetical protein